MRKWAWRGTVLGVLVALSGCAAVKTGAPVIEGEDAPSRSEAKADAGSDRKEASADVGVSADDVLASGTASHGAAPMALPFIEDDYAGALGRARAAGKPLFVEVWAPW